MNFLNNLIHGAYNLLWGELITIPLPGGNSLGLSLLVLLLIPTGIYFMIRTRFLPIRLFPEMLHVTMEKRSDSGKGSLSDFRHRVRNLGALQSGIPEGIGADGFQSFSHLEGGQSLAAPEGLVPDPNNGRILQRRLLHG